MAKDKTVALHGYTTDRNMTTDEEKLSQKELDAIAALRRQGAEGTLTWQQANEQANAIRAAHGYEIDQSGEVRTLAAEKSEDTAPVTVPEAEKLSAVDTKDLTDALDTWREEQEAGSRALIDAATEQSVQELETAREETEAALTAQHAALDLEEARAKDDQALYAHLRGDNGGIGAAQYDAIAAAAAQNRMAIRTARTTLANDTAKAMAQLRSQGEYEKAQALLELSQQYLGKLQEIKEWAAETNISVEKFNAQLTQWQAEYALEAEKNALNAEKFQSSEDAALQKTLAAAGQQLIKLGILPSQSQLTAMGITAEQAKAQMAGASSGTSSGSASKPAAGGSSANGSAADTDDGVDLDGLFAAAEEQGGYSWLKQKSVYTRYGLQSAPTQADYEEWRRRNVFNEAEISSIAKAWADDLYKGFTDKAERKKRIEAEYVKEDGWMTETDYYWLLHKLT